MFYTTTQRGHISVDLFLVRFSRRAQVIIDSIGSLLGFGTWSIIAYQTYLLGLRVLEAGDTTSFLTIPLSPFQFIFALGISFYSLTLLIQALRSLYRKNRKKRKGV
jgi:TRAP-type C4-dicarboxylate transport system permease small subunit